MRANDKKKRGEKNNGGGTVCSQYTRYMVQRSISPVGEKDFASCESFIAPREWACVPLAAQFLRYREWKTDAATSGGGGAKARRFSISPETAGTLFMLQEHNPAETGGPELRGLLYISRFGNATHCISDACFKDSEWIKTLRRFLRRKKIRSVSGEAAANIQIEKMCGGVFPRKQNFLFMKNEISSTDERSMDGCIEGVAESEKTSAAERKRNRAYAYASAGGLRNARVVRCGENDVERLCPLQEAYEAEELGKKTRKNGGQALRLRMRYTLQNQTILAYADGDQFLAKAGTNAKGIQWCQIGGVYTRPHIRGNGIAGVLLESLVRDIHREHKSAVLFVRPKNKAAIRVYRKTGFIECGGFRIAMRVFGRRF